jgi:hypothetical protein
VKGHPGDVQLAVGKTKDHWPTVRDALVKNLAPRRCSPMPGDRRYGFVK